jgi:hypothetical protein
MSEGAALPWDIIDLILSLRIDAFRWMPYLCRSLRMRYLAHPVLQRRWAALARIPSMDGSTRYLRDACAHATRTLCALCSTGYQTSKKARVLAKWAGSRCLNLYLYADREACERLIPGFTMLQADCRPRNPYVIRCLYNNIWQLLDRGLGWRPPSLSMELLWLADRYERLDWLDSMIQSTWYHMEPIPWTDHTLHRHYWCTGYYLKLSRDVVKRLLKTWMNRDAARQFTVMPGWLIHHPDLAWDSEVHWEELTVYRRVWPYDCNLPRPLSSELARLWFPVVDPAKYPGFYVHRAFAEVWWHVEQVSELSPAMCRICRAIIHQDWNALWRAIRLHRHPSRMEADIVSQLIPHQPRSSLWQQMWSKRLRLVFGTA